jgi:non-ribosomal peptide synthase protein (TIGR01720 family)
MLGVLKTGAAFVTVKSDEPAKRTARILENADAPVIITEQHRQHRFAGSSRLVLMDAHQEKLQRQNDCELTAPVDADSLACLLYHSSPDDAPHGTLISHRALRSATFAAELAIGIKDRVAHTLDLSLEGTCFEIFTALASGACIVSIPRQSLPPRKFAEFMREQRVTVLVTTSAVFTRLASQFPLALKKVHLILIKDPLRLAGSLAQTLPSQTLERVYGAYGYSEAGGPSLLYPLKKLVDGGAIATDSIAAGRMIYLLDQQLQPAPDGVLGEIYLGGEEVSLGYEKQPRRSAQTFVPDPFAKTPGTRMYSTGDWARRTEDGSLEFGPRPAGRLTIGGQRVETKEVEIILEQHEGIREAAVMAQETSEGTIALSAVLVAESDYAIDNEELRAFAAERLPEWMVPLNFATVDASPRTARGEVDTQALAARLRHKKDEGPRNQVEAVLAEIWARLLKREQVGIHDNFFELGGDSILSIQVVTQAQDAGVHITPRQLFERPTIAELAEVAGTHSAEAEADQGAITGPVPLTPIQTAFFEWNLAKPSHFNQAVLLDLTPGADSKHLENAVLALLQQHDVLRTRFTSGANGWEQSIELEPPKEIYQRRDLSTLQEREQTAAMESDANLTHASLDLQRGVLMRAAEYDLGSARGRRLLLVIHHLVVDGVSWRTLLTDLERAYEQLAQGQALSLGFKTTSYKRWSEALRQYSREEQVKQESAYWCSEARKNVGVLPRDNSQVQEESNTVDTLRSVTMTLEEEETRELLQDIPSVYNTQINDVLLTVAGQVFGEWTESGHVLVDLEGHGREELSAGIDLSRTVGWFTALYPVLLHATPTGQWEPGEALSTTKEQLRAVPNRGLGYGLLRYVSEDEGTRKQFQEMPKAEIIFNYLGQLDALIGEPRLFKLALESSGKAAAGENRRAYVLDVNAMVVQGKLQVNWGYSDKLHRRETIETLARRYMQCLKEVIAHCRKEEAGGFTPSDFPAANNMTQDELMQIGALLGK